MTETCKVHFLDPNGNRTEVWPIGADGISADVYSKLKDDNGDMYALTAYEDGKPETAFLKKEIWQMAEAQFAQIETEARLAR